MTERTLSDGAADEVRRKRGGQVVPLAHRFWAKVRVTSRCWEWTASRDENGYGFIGLFGHRVAKAHRVAWMLSIGPIPPGLLVLHSCDNPPCVRPDHLFLGTNDDNMADMVAKGRGAAVDGERNPRAILCVTDLTAIRDRYAAGNATQRQLGQEYGVAKSTIGAVITGQNWRRF